MQFGEGRIMRGGSNSVQQKERAEEALPGNGTGKKIWAKGTRKKNHPE